MDSTMPRRVWRAAAAAVLLAAGAVPGQAPAGDPALLAVRRLFEAAGGGVEAALMKAAEAVVAQGAAAVAPLTEGLAKRPGAAIVWALKCLREIDAGTGAVSLSGLADHPEPAVRAESLLAGAALIGRDFLPVVRAAARDKETPVRRRAYDALLLIASPDPETLALVAGGLIEDDFWIASCVWRFFDVVPKPADGGSDPVIPALGSVAERVADAHAAPVFSFLAARGGAAAHPYVVQALRSRRPAILAGALTAAGTLRIQEAFDTAAATLDSRDRASALAALECLSQLKHPRSVPLLVDLLDSTRDQERKDAVAVALRKITGRTFGFDTAAWRKWLDSSRG